MKRYVLCLAYEGTRYAGWQRQPQAVTVAGTLEAALSRLLPQPVKLIGAGRTDAGVHARAQWAHFDGPEALPSAFLHRLNRLLPSDIQVWGLYAAESTFHARHSALSRTYRYYVRLTPNLFGRTWSWLVSPLPDLNTLREVAKTLEGHHDFRAFAKEPKSYPDSTCLLFRAEWQALSPDLWYFEVEANRFLRAMVRALVGAQIRLAQGKLRRETFFTALYQGDRRWGMHLAPPQGLFLWKVRYPSNSLYLLDSYGVLTPSYRAGPAPGFTPEPPPDPISPPIGSADR